MNKVFNAFMNEINGLYHEVCEQDPTLVEIANEIEEYVSALPDADVPYEVDGTYKPSEDFSYALAKCFPEKEDVDDDQTDAMIKEFDERLQEIKDEYIAECEANLRADIISVRGM